MAAVAMGYDTAVIGGTMALESFRRDFGMAAKNNDTVQGSIVSSFQGGCVVGSLAMFPLAERLGRRVAVVISAAIFMVGGILMTAAQGTLAMVVAGRAVAGLGIGACSLIVPVYIAETAPPSIRGRLVGIFEIASQAGGMLGFWINYAADRSISQGQPAQWMLPLGLQLVPGALLGAGILLCPESPRWLALQERWEEAGKTLAALRRLPGEHDHVRNELAEMAQQIRERAARRLTFGGMVKKLVQRGVRNRVGIGLLLMACQNLTGVNVVTYYSPRLFETLGMEATETKLFATGLYGVVKTAGMLLFSFLLVEKLGRRMGLIWGALLGSLPMWYLGVYVMKVEPQAEWAKRNAWGYLGLACIYLYGFIYCATWQGITWVYCSEIFPLDIRMLCTALTTAHQWLWSFLVSRTTPYMLTSMGYGVFLLFASLMVAMGIWAALCIPETKGHSLEDMEDLFSSSKFKAVWHDLVPKKQKVSVQVVRRLAPADNKKRRSGVVVSPLPK
ncbi:hypothetical protein CDD82_2658 [Ophiocordyceps australis]|uniref:Major facilitator superfamily (MFS) profile domain-containing protein n=1 Tax=Ophiocordyceps australis TaxID=1399860 RepID=A0A2C5ZUU3_9HYPO|nr:hypothetical protein CDD82_2658 [Ophiocordyceps australis]